MRKDFHAKAQSREELNDIAAILLAAGRSRRMGAFKPLLPFGDKTVIEQCIANLTGAGIQNITVVVGHRADEIREQLKDCEITFALNPDPESEMSVSIARGVEQVDEQAKAIVIALVDHPAIAPAVIRLLIDEWRNGHGKLFQPEYNGRGGHPVLIDLAYRDELLSLDPQLGLRAFFDRHRAERRRLPVNSPYVARDMDTWEDYRQLHEQVFGALPECV